MVIYRNICPSVHNVEFVENNLSLRGYNPMTHLVSSGPKDLECRGSAFSSKVDPVQAFHRRARHLDLYGAPSGDWDFVNAHPLETLYSVFCPMLVVSVYLPTSKRSLSHTLEDVSVEFQL